MSVEWFEIELMAGDPGVEELEVEVCSAPLGTGMRDMYCLKGQAGWNGECLCVNVVLLPAVIAEERGEERRERESRSSRRGLDTGVCFSPATSLPTGHSTQ